MGKDSRGPAEVQKSLVQQVQSIAAHTRGISDELAKMSSGLRDGVQSSANPTTELLTATSQLSAMTAHASTSLSECLGDLVSMGEAMAPVLEQSPEAAPALLLNFYSTFVTQMNAFYAEMGAGWGRGAQGFGRAKATFYGEPAPATPRAALSAVGGGAGAAPPPSSSLAAAPAAEGGEDDEDGSSAPATRVTTRSKKHALLESEDADGEADFAAVKKKPGKKKKGAAAVPAAADDTDSGSPLQASAAAPAPLTPTSGGDPDSYTSRYSAEDTMTALAAAAESGASTAAPKRSRKSAKMAGGADPADASPQPTAEELAMLAASEPAYLTVTSTVEAALGSVVIGSRPNVFSKVAAFAMDEPVASYYIRLVRPGSLAHFIYSNYLSADEESQADFLCDVLETDCAEVDPFTSASGEVTVADPDDLSPLPPCAWAVGSSEDNERRLYTMYALMRQPPRLGPTALIHDALNMDGVRDEVLHLVTLVDTLPQYAKVSCMVHSDVRSVEVPNQKQAAIMSFSRSGFAQHGFTEVSEGELNAALSRAKPARASTIDLYQGRDRNTATAAFQPPVQLASLDQPAGDAGISLGGVARGAMQGGMEVLKAPFAMGKAVGGALLDVTGVSGAVRNNIEGLFRKSFPELAAETVVETFNCAWMRKSMPSQGYVFITTHWLCFQSTVSAAKFSIEYDEIRDIVKSKSAKMFENALEIRTHLNDSIFLTSFLQRDQAYSALMKEWLKQ